MNNYEWDEGKLRENADKHDIDFTAIYDFDWDTAAQRSNTTHGELRWVATGYIGTRLHTVIYTERGNRRRIISLRIASNRERREYAEA
ncbi:MAG: BrnT family toxin [Dehalococcoidia bacterium]|nr:BrnT family toxin [Dehalococcoidia bacterium]